MSSIIKFLANNPLPTLALLILYVAGLWYVVAQVWVAGHEIAAIIIILTISLVTKANAKKFIEKLKKAKSK